MRSMLRRRLSVLLRPATARLPLEAEPEWLKTYRVYCLLTGGFVVLSGFAYRFSAHTYFDPLWMRAGLSVLCFGLLLSSYRFQVVARNLNHLVYGVFVLLSIWLTGLAFVNHFAADYSVTLVFFVAALSLALSFVPSARLPLLWYQISMTAVVTGAVLLEANTETERIVLVGCMAGIAFVTDVAASVRARLEKDRERYRDNLVAANERAEEMLRLKSSFINNMNHEIRTPLTGIIGFAEIISETAGREQQEYARVIQDSGRRLLDTLSSILDLAHLESGCFDLHFEAVDLNAAAREAAALLESKARKEELSVDLDLSTDPVFAHADHTAVARIVYNLVSNGIKFTTEGGVTVATYVQNDRACVSVEDTGIGINETFLPHIFDEFKQQSSGVNRSHEGCGLGLTVTKRLIELMDGNITILSAPGVGSKFVVALPVSASSTDPVPHAGDGSRDRDVAVPEARLRTRPVS